MSENSTSSDFLYIILTLVAAIIGLTQKTSSKQKGITIRQLASEEQPETQSSLQNEIVVDYSNSTNEEYFTEYNFVPTTEHTKEEETFSAPEERKTIVLQSAEIEESIDFDARTAFIYSEILTRKYN